MRHNPFIRPIAAILREQTGAISEYDLFRLLDIKTFDTGTKESADLILYQRHFMVMNALYNLQPLFLTEGKYLAISPLEITLEPINENTTTQPDLTDSKLREYYLDWDELEKSTAASVEELLQSFWERYFSYDQLDEALKVLSVTSDTGWGEIQKQYRRLASKNHPDKGGDAIHFLAIREAYEIVCQHKHNLPNLD